MIDEVLLNLVESVLGPSIPTSRGNHAFKCPTCLKQDGKHKLEICFDTEGVNKKGKPAYQNYGCWRQCGLQGERIYTLFKKLEVDPSKFESLSFIDKTTKANPNYNKQKQTTKIKLPKEFKSLNNYSNLDIVGKHAFKYLTKTRNLTLLDIQKYNIGYCSEGRYSNRVIIPSYDENGELNYFTSRTFLPDEPRRYDNPPLSRNIIPLEMFINWDLPIILCEGMFDAITLKRNTIPLLGLSITEGLMKKLSTNKVEKIYLILDKEEQKKAISQSEKLINEGKKVYLVNLDKKDPSEVGFVNMLNILYNTKPLTLYDLMELKFNL